MSAQHCGLEVSLVRQKRLDNPPDSPYDCLWWWTFYPGYPKSFRRFYKYKGKFWNLPVEVALGMMRDANGRDMFLPGDHPSPPSQIIDSRELPVSERRRLLSSMICDEGEPAWGDNPTFSVSQTSDKRGIWREIMVVDSQAEICTFRSTTTFKYADYKLAANAP